MEYIIKSNVDVTQNKGLLISLQRAKAVKYFSEQQKRSRKPKGLQLRFYFV